jgi:hypothetical protein
VLNVQWLFHDLLPTRRSDFLAPQFFFVVVQQEIDSPGSENAVQVEPQRQF